MTSPWVLDSFFSPSHGAILLGLRSYEHNSFPGPRMRTGPFGSRRVETIGTNHGVLDISTIDTPCGTVQTACFPSQVIEHFSNEQSPTALTEHRSSFCFQCHPYVRLTRRRSSGSVNWLLPHRLWLTRVALWFQKDGDCGQSMPRNWTTVWSELLRFIN